MADYYEITADDEQDEWFPASVLPVGKLARIRHGDGLYGGHVVLRCYGVLVSLTDPQTVWTNVTTLKFLVRLLEYPRKVVLSPKPVVEKSERDENY